METNNMKNVIDEKDTIIKVFSTRELFDSMTKDNIKLQKLILETIHADEASKREGFEFTEEVVSLCWQRNKDILRALSCRDLEGAKMTAANIYTNECIDLAYTFINDFYNKYCK